MKMFDPASKQPVAAAANVRKFESQFHSRGIFRGSWGPELDHDVAVVGDGKSNEVLAYEDGNIRMRKGVDAIYELLREKNNNRMLFSKVKMGTSTPLSFPGLT